MAYKVMLDPGHAESTAGKRSFDGTLREYEFNRDVARRMKELLERHGIEVYYSCDVNTSTDISLSTRVATEHQIKPDIFVSIHANAFGTDWNTARGWEVYISAMGSNRENLARKIMAQAIPYLGVPSRGLKTADFYVLVNTIAPAVLIEHEFYTCQDSVALLKSSDWRQKCAISNTKGILDYFGLSFIEETPVVTTPTEDVWRIFVNGTKVISLTGFAHSKDYAITTYPNEDVILENTRTLERVKVCSKPVVVTPPTPTIDYENELIRVFVDGVKVYALTGYTKCVNDANAKYQGKHVELECVKDLKRWDLGIIPAPVVVTPPVVTPDPPVVPTPTYAYKIMGASECTIEQAETYLHSINPNAPVIASFYKEECEKEGLRWDIMFAQSCVETGHWTFKGDAKPEWNNFGGLGVTGIDYDPALDVETTFVDGVIEIKTPDGKSVGCKFATPQLGIKCQAQHLKGYASELPLTQSCVDPRYKWINPKGKAPYVENLGKGNWASDTEYASKIISVLEKIKATKVESKPIPQPNVSESWLAKLLSLLVEIIIKMISKQE